MCLPAHAADHTLTHIMHITSLVMMILQKTRGQAHRHPVHMSIYAGNHCSATTPEHLQRGFGGRPLPRMLSPKLKHACGHLSSRPVSITYKIHI